jgi:cytochrome P450
MSIQSAQLKLDFQSPAFKANPYPTYARLRHEAPVASTRLPDGHTTWLISRYEDVVVALKDPRMAKNRRRVTTSNLVPYERLLLPLFRSLQYNMLDLDPPDHTRLRALVHKAFTPRLIEQLRERIQRLADELIDRATARKDEFDLVAEYALPIPATVIAELLGVPVGDRDRFHRWSNKAISASSGRDVLTALPSLLLFMRYVRRLVALRRREPRDDLISALVQVEQAGDRLSADELTSMIFVLLIAGHETTVNLIASGTLALLENRDQLERLRTEPPLLASGTAVEELLRFTSPVQLATERYALEPVQFAGTTIPYGALVHAVIASANHDERQFAEPDRLDLSRTPNPHLAFGQGLHYCLGAPLARLEGQIAFGTLVRRLPELELTITPDSLRWRRGFFLRGLEQLPLRIRTETCHHRAA